MSTQIVLPSSCDNHSEILARVNCGDSFQISIHLLLDPPNAIDFQSIIVKAKFYVLGRESNFVEFSTDTESELINLDPVRSRIQMLFRDYDFKPGMLYCEYKFLYPDSLVGGGTRVDSVKQFTGIALI